jgi:hypothetical protein
VRKPAFIPQTAMLLYMEEFAWITFSVVRVWALLSFVAGIRKEKFAYFLHKMK